MLLLIKPGHPFPKLPHDLSTSSLTNIPNGIGPIPLLDGLQKGFFLQKGLLHQGANVFESFMLDGELRF